MTLVKRQQQPRRTATNSSYSQRLVCPAKNSHRAPLRWPARWKMWCWIDAERCSARDPRNVGNSRSGMHRTRDLASKTDASMQASSYSSMMCISTGRQRSSRRVRLTILTSYLPNSAIRKVSISLNEDQCHKRILPFDPYILRRLWLRYCRRPLHIHPSYLCQHDRCRSPLA